MVGKIYLNKWIKSEIIWTKIALASHGHDRNYPNVPRLFIGRNNDFLTFIEIYHRIKE